MLGAGRGGPAPSQLHCTICIFTYLQGLGLALLLHAHTRRGLVDEVDCVRWGMRSEHILSVRVKRVGK